MSGGSAGTLSSSEGLLADVLPGGYPRLLGGSFERGELVSGEAHGYDLGAWVAGRWAASSGNHALRIAYTESLVKGLRCDDFYVYDKCMTTAAAVEAQQEIDPGWGEDYGMGRVAYVVPSSGICVWMFRKGQRVRFYDTNGWQVGPEHKNVAPALYWAASEAWIDPFHPNLSLACTVEVRTQLADRRLEALAKQERGTS